MHCRRVSALATNRAHDGRAARHAHLRTGHRSPATVALAFAISFDKHSSFTDFTQRSANAFKFGLRAGSGSVLTSPDSIILRNDSQYLASRSWIRYRQLSRKPHSSMVTFLAICFIQASLGCGVIPATSTRRLSRWINRVGGGVTPAVRPHHRAYGTVHGGSREARPSLKKIEEAQESPFRQ